MRVLILGGTGMLGHKLVQRLEPKFEVFSTIRGSLSQAIRLGILRPERTLENVDAVDARDIEAAIDRIRPDAVINAIGVIKQLPSAEDVVNTLMVNSILPHRLAELSKRYGFRLLLISTDCVFSGDRGNYNEADPADALDLYGRSKEFGEVAEGRCLTLRTSIVGRELVSSHSLIEWFLSNRGKKVKGFTRAIYSGFPTIVFADIIADLLQHHPELNGLYHVSSEPIDKYRLLSLVNAAFGAGVEIEPDETFAIDRSLDSSRFKNETGFRPATWEKMVEQMALDGTPYDRFRE